MLRAHYRETPKLQAGRSKKGKDKMEEKVFVFLGFEAIAAFRSVALSLL